MKSRNKSILIRNHLILFLFLSFSRKIAAIPSKQAA